MKKTFLKRVELASLCGPDVVTAWVTENTDGSAIIGSSFGTRSYPPGTWRVVDDARATLGNSYGGLVCKDNVASVVELPNDW